MCSLIVCHAVDSRPSTGLREIRQMDRDRLLTSFSDAITSVEPKRESVSGAKKLQGRSDSHIAKYALT